MEDMAALAPIKARMLERGHKVYALTRPRHSPGGPTRYWLNGHGLRLEDGVQGQPCGWYTLEELDAQKYVEDLRRHMTVPSPGASRQALRSRT